MHSDSNSVNSDGVNKHWSKLDNLSYPPIYIHWDDGMVKKVYLLPDSPSLINIKKGLASLFQLHVSNTPVKEVSTGNFELVYFTFCKMLYNFSVVSICLKKID